VKAAATVWRNVSLGVFFLAVAALLYLGEFWPWILVVFCGMWLVNAVFKGQWRWAPHPLLWGLGLGYAFASATVGGWAMFWALCGASIILSYLIGLVPHRSRKGRHRAPGARIVIDAETVSSDPASKGSTMVPNPTYSAQELRILEEAPRLLMSMIGYSEDQARSEVKGLLDSLHSELKTDGTYDLPENMGDIILGNARTDHPVARKYADRMSSMLPQLRKEGVTEDDIKGLWNQLEICRCFYTESLPNLFRLAFTFHEMKRGHLSLNDASAITRKRFPTFGNPEDMSLSEGDDRPLPLELFGRVSMWLVRRVAAQPNFLGDFTQWGIGNYSSANALVRSELRSGKL